MTTTEATDTPARTTTTVRQTTIAGFPAAVASPAGATAPPVVFLHGAFADHHGFDGWVQRAADRGHEAVAPSRRGRLDLGPADAAGLTFDDYVADTIAVLDELGHDRPVLVGHSLGALIAQRLAEQGRASAIALVSPAPPAMLTAQPIALPKFAPLLPKIMTGRPFVVGNDACSVLALNRIPEAERPAIHAQLTPESGKVYRAAMMGTIRVDASKVTVPVMVLSGNEDRIISTKLAKKTARHYGVEADIRPDHGHWILGEPGWEQVADDVLSWATRAVA